MSDDSIKQEFLSELESIIESDEAYGSNVQVLTYALKEDVINGKFKDSWNNRVYEFIVDIDGISYKPAVKLDSFSTDEMPARFDAYSDGYVSLVINTRLDKGVTGKRVKKPKCGGTAYGCGFGCIGLQKTCRILSSGKKAGTNQGKAIGQQRLNKLMELSKKLYLAGDKKGADLANATATNISKVRTKYNAGGQALVAERALAKQAEEKIKTPAKVQAKQPVKPKSESIKPSSDPTTNPKTHSIKTQKEFEDVMLHVADKLNKKTDYHNYIPIGKIREEIGELIPRDKFDDYMLAIQKDNKIRLMGGGGSRVVYSNDMKVENAGYKQDIQILPATQKELDNVSSTKKQLLEKILQERPELDPMGLARPYATGKAIASKADFDKTMIDVHKALNKSFLADNLVPIEQIKEVLKDRISEEDFDRFLTDGSPKGEFTLQSAGERNKNKYKSVKNFIGEEKHYVTLKE